MLHEVYPMWLEARWFGISPVKEFQNQQVSFHKLCEPNDYFVCDNSQ